MNKLHTSLNFLCSCLKNRIKTSCIVSLTTLKNPKHASFLIKNKWKKLNYNLGVSFTTYENHYDDSFILEKKKKNQNTNY